MNPSPIWLNQIFILFLMSECMQRCLLHYVLHMCNARLSGFCVFSLEPDNGTKLRESNYCSHNTLYP